MLTLEAGTRFNVVAFATAADVWSEGPVRATWRNKARLRDWIEEWHANGWTNAGAALALGLEQPGVDTLFFLTDGLPTVGETDPERLLEQVRLAQLGLHERVRVHTIAFFLPQAEAFLSRLAATNNGHYRLEQ